MNTAVRYVLLAGLLLLALTPLAGYWLASAQADPPLTPACKWIWVGPVTGWVMEEDNCNGNCCDPPSYQGTVSGQEAFTPCRACDL